MKIHNLLPLLAIAVAPFALAEGPAKADKPAKEAAHECSATPKGVELTPADAAKYKAAHKVAEKDPAVIKAKEAKEAAREKAKAAREKARESKSEADRDAAKAAQKASKEANKAAREAIKAAMLKADPSLGDLLAKVDKARAEGAEGGEGKGEKGKKQGKSAKGEKSDKCDKESKDGKDAECADCSK